ncbi:beta propeller repeat protein [Spirosoma pulveris]
MKTLLYCGLLLLALSCKKAQSDSVAPKPDTVLAEYPDWYTIKAPIDKEIVGVWGNWDKTLLISTSRAVFRSIDKGNHWQEVLPPQSIGIFGIVQNQDTLFTMTTLVGYRALASAEHFSVDDGMTWQSYMGRNRIFDIPSPLTTAPFPINPVLASNGISYTINQVFLDGPTATTGIFETPGIITSDGRRIDLPQLHQLQSLYLDDQQRLYIAGTDAVCGRGHSGESFSFCNSKQGRGVVYISKRPLP